MATFAADSATLNYLSDLHHRIAQYYRKAHDQIITHGNDITHELRHAERYDALSKYQQWEDSLSHLLDESNTHQAWSDYFHHLAEEVTQTENTLSGQ